MREVLPGQPNLLDLIEEAKLAAPAPTLYGSTRPRAARPGRRVPGVACRARRLRLAVAFARVDGVVQLPAHTDPALPAHRAHRRPAL
jgi:hypothetical protein